MSSTVQAGPTATAVGPARPSREKTRGQWRKRIEIGVFAGPALLVYVSFVFFPVVLAAYYSFFNWNGLGPLDRFIGFDNYTRALTDPVFHGAIGNNILILVLSLLIQGPLAIAIALLLNRRIRGRGVLRLMIFVPYVLSEVIVGLAWRLILQPHGPFDTVMDSLGLGGLRQLWLADPSFVMWTLFAVLTWKYLGLAIILFLAGLQGVPEELSEAASIDGASWWQREWQITIPILRRTIAMAVIISVIGSLLAFTQFYVLTKGGPGTDTTTVVQYIYNRAFVQLQLGAATALSIVLVAVVGIVTAVQFWLLREKD